MVQGPVTKLSVNVNKVATLRNARGGDTPGMIEAVSVCVAAGAPGITIHPRKDERHIRAADVEDIADYLAGFRDSVEFNIEGDPRRDLIDRVLRIRPHQCTLVPVRPGEVTSEAGWPPDTDPERLGAIIRELQAVNIRVSVFVEAQRDAIAWAASVGADRVELYTEPYASAFGTHEEEDQLARYTAACAQATALGMGVNAGHDLDLDNLGRFLGAVKGVDEVSIGHALISTALFRGLSHTVGSYLEVIRRALE